MSQVGYALIDGSGRVTQHGLNEEDGLALIEAVNRGATLVRISPLLVAFLERNVNKGAFAEEIGNEIEPPDADGIGVAGEKRFAIRLRRTARLRLSKTVVAENEDFTISHDAPEPVKVWINRMPIAGEASGKVQSEGEVYHLSSFGDYRIRIDDRRYLSDPVILKVLSKEEAA